MKWAKQLKILSNIEIEKRVLRILEYFNTHQKNAECWISNFDATGFLGNKLTKVINEIRDNKIDMPNLINIFKESGQVLEMDLGINTENSNYRIIIVRGTTVEIMGDNLDLPDFVFGDYKELNPDLFD